MLSDLCVDLRFLGLFFALDLLGFCMHTFGVLGLRFCMYRLMYTFDLVLVSSFAEKVFLVLILLRFGPGNILIWVIILSGLYMY